MEEGRRERLERLERIEALRSEQALLSEELLSAAVMDDEGMTDGENRITIIETRLTHINAELKDLLREK